ncbi:MAG: trehalose 6-phosphatase [Gemmatimonadetes bacterium]|nr:trehalose 6-phosphatase [Gemmatimonadota bacterium]
MLVHALQRVPEWSHAWRRAGRLVLLLDFDGTLAPIVERPELAGMPGATRAALERLRARPDVTLAVVSGRGLADVRALAAIDGIAYAGNHGMEIEGPGIHRIHPEALEARPALDEVVGRLAPALEGIPGAFVEDKGLTLSIHFRQAPEAAVPRVRAAVHDAAAAHGDALRVTAGKMVLEVRPRVDWHKGRAVRFLLEQMRPPAGAPVLYLGDDRTDEDAFAALEDARLGEGVIVADPLPGSTAARSFLHAPAEVGELFAALADAAEG